MEKTTKVSGALLVSALALGVPQTLANAAPNVQSCPAGYHYDITAHSQGQYGKGPAVYDYNYNATSASLSLSISGTQTVDYALTATGSVSVSDILSSAQLSFGASLGQSSSGSVSATATVSVPAHEYGVAQVGATFYSSTGNYYYVSATCYVSQQQTIPARFPESPGSLLMITGNNTSQTPPWPQTN